MKAVITVIGKDATGIIHKVSGILYRADVNILDISQTIMQDIFTMVMMIDISKSSVSFDKLRNELSELGGNLGLSIRIQHEDIFNSMHRI